MDIIECVTFSLSRTLYHSLVIILKGSSFLHISSVTIRDTVFGFLTLHSISPPSTCLNYMLQQAGACCPPEILFNVMANKTEHDLICYIRQWGGTSSLINPIYTKFLSRYDLYISSSMSSLIRFGQKIHTADLWMPAFHPLPRACSILGRRCQDLLYQTTGGYAGSSRAPPEKKQYIYISVTEQLAF